jgi:glutathione synthase/RimK-type ligase-like ATP-grasp enzyme
LLNIQDIDFLVMKRAPERRHFLAENDLFPAINCHERPKLWQDRLVRLKPRCSMRSLQEFRTAKPGFYPDQTIYAEFACAQFGLEFAEIDGGSGLVFSVASPTGSIYFGAGRCSWFPQNNATASALATDKYFANRILQRAGIATLGGQYFFLHDRHRAHRAEGHERADALDYFATLNRTAFVKPLTGSRGDFAQAIDDEVLLSSYLDQVLQYYDAILMQPVFSGREYRIFLLDDEVLYCVRKQAPAVVGDGVRSVRALLQDHDAALRSRGVSSAAAMAGRDDRLDAVLAKGERWAIPGRMNLSAGGTMVFEAPRDEAAAFALARHAAKILGLRVAAIDMFTDIDGEPGSMRVIEVNANPSIRFLEQCGRAELILEIWRHTFVATGLLVV